MKKLKNLGGLIAALALGVASAIATIPSKLHTHVVQPFTQKVVAPALSMLNTALNGLLTGPECFAVRTCDVAFTYRMTAGIPGDINRVHPFEVFPGLMNVTNPVRLYGDPTRVDTATSSYRGFIAADQNDATGVRCDGILVRAFPIQQQSGGMSAALGTAAPVQPGVHDYIRNGCVMVKLPAGQAVVKGGQAFVWCTASTGAHVQGGFENALDAGDTVPLTNVRFTGPADALGNVEVEIFKV